MSAITTKQTIFYDFNKVSQNKCFDIHAKSVEISVGTSSRYKKINLNPSQIDCISILTQMIGKNYEQSLRKEGWKFIVYGADYSSKMEGRCDSTEVHPDEKNLFKVISTLVLPIIFDQTELNLSADYLQSVHLEKTVDYTGNSTIQASRIQINLCEWAATDLDVDNNPSFNSYKSHIFTPGMDVSKMIRYPGQK